MKRPDDIVSSMLTFVDDSDGGFFMEMHANPAAHVVPCRVFWGSHGCERPAGHDGDHWCDCCECEDHPDDESCVAGPPYYGVDTDFYGDDVPGWKPPDNDFQVFA